VFILTCFVICVFCNVWVYVCMGFICVGVLVICVLVFTVFWLCVFLYLFLFVTSVRTTATE